MKKHKFIAVLFFATFFLFAALEAVHAENFSNNTTYKDNQILVKFKKDSRKIYDSFLNNFAKSYNLEYQSDKNVVDNVNKGYFLFVSTDTFSVNDKIKIIEKDARVKDAQPNFLFSPAKKKSSNQDKFFNREWWIYNSGKIGTAGSDIYLLNVWQQEQKSWPGVTIGLVDTGVNPQHADLKKNIVAGYDFVHNKRKGMQDKDGHGSFIAGLIASQVSNKKGIAGLSRLNHLKVMPLKFDFSTDEAITALAYAQAKGVRIINASWGTDEFDQALHDAISAFPGIVVAAAGNDGAVHSDTKHFYPCDFDLPNVVCVGASDENDRLADYSDYGPTVDILAPGGSEGAPLISLDAKTNHYDEEIGSSFSAGLVSGAAGLVLSANPNLSNQEIIDLILENARVKTDLNGKVMTSGILNIKGAVNREIFTNAH
jgi:subtilisin family serine protease